MIIRAENNKGFTLVELLIVVAMIGIVSAIAFPNLLKQVPKWRANGVTRDVSGKLMLARMKAIQNNKKYGVEFTLGDRDSFKIKWYDTTVPEWKDEGYEGQSGESVEITLYGCATTNRVVFNPNGTAGGCGAIWINEGKANERKLSLSTNTGRVDVQYCEKETCIAP